jgi:putative ABC transport system substrate-binding protein
MTAPTYVRAQAGDGKRRVGLLFQFARPAPGADPRWDTFVQALGDLGYVEGQNIVFEYAYTEGDSDRRLHEAARLVATKPDVIVAGVGADAVALRMGTPTIPIVVVAGGDLEGAGLVASLARPGGNVTGLQTLQADLAGKRLELLKIVAPNIRRVGVLHEKLWGEVIRVYYSKLVTDLEATARTLKIQITVIPMGGADSFDRAEEHVREARVDALFIANSPFMYQHRQRFVELAARQRLPAIYEAADYVQAGGLMSYGANITSLYSRAATYVDRILKGARPANLPVEQPTKFEFVINTKTAKQLGLTIPQSLLLRADHVVE